MKSLLIGEAATTEHQAAIQTAIEGTPDVRSLIHMRTLHLGPDELLVAAKIDLGPDLDATAHRRGDRRGRGAGALGRADRTGDLPRAGPAGPGARGGLRPTPRASGSASATGAVASWPTSLRSRKTRVAIRPIRAIPAPTANAYWKPSVSARVSCGRVAPGLLHDRLGVGRGDGGEDRDAQRAADLLGGVDQPRGDAGLVGLHALEGGDRDRHEGEPEADAGEQEARARGWSRRSR